MLEHLRRQGYAGTGIKAVLGAAHTPYGSLYHHFPGGKEELAAEALRQSGGAYRDLVASYLHAGADPQEAIAAFFTDGAELQASADFVNLCPVSSVAAEVATSNPRLREVAAAAFESWLVGPIACFEAAGLDRQGAADLAAELLMLAEGALLLAQVQRSPQPVLIARGAALALARQAFSTPPLGRPAPGGAGS